MVTLDTIISLTKRRGYIFQDSEIYGGQASVYDYGPLGVELKRNLKNQWWERYVHRRDDIEGLDSAIIMKPDVWKASGHVDHFTDPLVECKECHSRYRVDQLNTENCPNCGLDEFTEPRQYNLLFRTFIGPVEEDAEEAYLRPETAQGIFVNFSNVQTTARQKLPFGIAQIGKAFRNEVTTKSFTFRTLEFEQMEIEYFVDPDEADAFFKEWKEERFQWYKDLGIDEERLRLRQHEEDELAHYADVCFDVEYRFPDPLGWSELEGVANRTDYDLKQHSEESGQKLTYYDQQKEEHVQPYIIEPSAGVDRIVLALLFDAYNEEELDGDKTRTVLQLDPDIAPYKVAVFPLLRNREELVDEARDISDRLKDRWNVVYDEAGSIGKLYRRQDEIGTPYCITVDPDSMDDRKVTVRDRDTMEQDRVAIDRLEEYLEDKLD